VLFVKELFEEEDKKIPYQIFEFAVLFVKELFEEEDK